MDSKDTMRRFQEARFGAFIHYGLYSILGRSEWAMYNEGIPIQEYGALMRRFRPPERFSPREWVELAKRAGARYCVLTARHHDGFCLWDSATTGFTSVRSPCRRDIVLEFVEAVRDAGLMVGLYFSLLDWSEPAYWSGPRRDLKSWGIFVEKVHAQVRELVSSYGRLDILWYDGFWASDNPPFADAIDAQDWLSRQLNAMVRRAQPGIIINDRTGLEEDFGTPEQKVIEQARPWEACMTTNDNWGFHRGDRNWKTPRQLIGSLVHSVSRGGNFILNMGPRADGSVPGQARSGFEALGSWLSRNGNSVYGCGKSPHLMREALDGGYFCNTGIWTAGKERLYYHILRWPGEELGVRTGGVHLLAAKSLATGESFSVESRTGASRIKGLPRKPIDPYDTVIECEYLSEEPTAIPRRTSRT